MAGEPGDYESRFTALFGRTYSAVLAYARRRVPVDAADEVVAETFLAAWRRLETIPDDPLPWLYRSAHFEILRRYREHQRAERLQNRLVDLDRGPEPDIADRIAWRQLLAQALLALDAKDREVLQLTAWEELSAGDAAVVLGCSVVALRVRLPRARRRLGRIVADLESPSKITTLRRPVPAPDQVPDTDPTSSRAVSDEET